MSPEGSKPAITVVVRLPDDQILQVILDSGGWQLQTCREDDRTQGRYGQALDGGQLAAISRGRWQAMVDQFVGIPQALFLNIYLACFTTTKAIPPRMAIEVNNR